MRRSFLVRNRTRVGLALFLALLPALFFVQHPWPEETYVDFVLDSAGYMLAIAGVLGRLWCTLYIGGNKHETLQRTGPYSVVRHPLYVSNLLLGLALAALSENPIVLFVVVAYFWIQYRSTIRHEEAALEATFGESYREYARTVPCFIPKLSHFHSTPPASVNLSPLYAEAARCLAFLAVVPLFELIALLHESGVVPFISFP